MSDQTFNAAAQLQGGARDVRRKLQTRRRRVNRIALTLSMLAMAFGLLWLVWILFTTIQFGIGGLSLDLFTQSTPAQGDPGGGLLNAIAGSLIMVGCATAVGTPIGILAGIYLAEYGQKSWFASLVRFINDILLSGPSIVVGLFVYAILVAPFHGFSGWAGAAALALLQIPVVIRTTENMLKLVPNALREAAIALGTPKWKMVLSITLKSSISGVMTGVLLAIARITGETAPLLFTSLNSQFFGLNMTKPMASLPVTIFQFALNVDPHLQSLAWAGVFLITLGVLGLNVLARSLFKSR
ncbi:phosphate ABC transporter permease PstA [Pararobbsia silviterrae]|uniref:Phosphate transport system permease protein PstA n=1 Tax=Pararobbsia silviterrae TaxID=1792498 RepID=A0A494Y718_9BURK|nr:phosphate ABC transporter permease PstA [Pararobbsia silviterrae]RKP56411.1 phosphate ABC transporter permease PstA [Pararobbsia silviterrae]